MSKPRHMQKRLRHRLFGRSLFRFGENLGNAPSDDSKESLKEQSQRTYQNSWETKQKPQPRPHSCLKQKTEDTTHGDNH